MQHILSLLPGYHKLLTRACQTNSDAALAAYRLRAALKDAGAAAAAEFEEGYNRACQQDERGRRRQGDQPLMGDGDGDRRVEEEEERRVREDRCVVTFISTDARTG